MIKKIFRFLFKAILWFIGITFLWVLLYKWVPVPFTSLMAIRYFEDTEKFQLRHDWVPIEEMSSYLPLAVMCAEDQNFLKHNGFDMKAIEKAMKGNKAGKRVRGASTISQQTAKNVFLWPHRNWFRKGMEAYFTFLIELLWDKERIMEVYLNSIEMGNGVFGAEAAAQYYFHKPAKKLTKYQAASIAVILPNPRRYSATRSTTYMENRRAWVIQQMRYYGNFTLKKKQ